jgi:hypothetical protein
VIKRHQIQKQFDASVDGTLTGTKLGTKKAEFSRMQCVHSNVPRTLATFFLFSNGGTGTLRPSAISTFSIILEYARNTFPKELSLFKRVQRVANSKAKVLAVRMNVIATVDVDRSGRDSRTKVNLESE